MNVVYKMAYKIPAPSQWQDFERKIKELFKLILGDPQGQLHGTSGQKQLGVDFFGYRNKDINQPVGVQCKEKSWKKKVTVANLRAEVKEAQKFTPTLSEFILVTTAPDDVKIQKEAREIEKELATSGTPFRVTVWGWDTIQDEILKYKDQGMLKLWCPEILELANQLATQSEFENTTIDDFGVMGERVAKAAMEEANERAQVSIDRALHEEIDAYRDKILEGKTEVALELLNARAQKIGDTTSNWARYRLFGNIGACYHNMGDREEAIRYFEYAYSFAPENPRANANYVLAAYLKSNRHQCKERAAVAVDIGDPHPHTFVHYLYCADTQDELEEIISKIPEALINDAEITAARIDKLRDFDAAEWHRLAVENKDHESIYVRRIWADAILQDQLEASGSSLGLTSDIHKDELQNVEGIYQSLWDDAVSHNTRRMHFAFAHNLAIVLQLLGQKKKALDVLESALDAYPEDRDLNYQKATLLAQAGDMEAARKTLDGVKLTPEMTIFLADINLGHDDKKSLELLKKIRWQDQTQAVQLRARSTEFSAKYNSKSKKASVLRALNRMIADFPDRIVPLSLKLQYQFKNDPDKVSETLDGVRALISTSLTPEELVNAAEVFHLAGCHDEAFDLLFEQIDFSRHTQTLNLILDCARASDDPSKYVKVFEEISPEVVGEEKYYRLKADLGYKTFNLPIAKEGIQKALEFSNNDLALSIQYVDILHRTGEDSLIPEFLASINFQGQGTKRQNIDFILRIERFLSKDQAFNFLYKLVLENPNDTEIFNFAVNFYLAKSLSEVDWLSNDKVANDYHVEVVSGSGEKQAFVVTEDNSLYRFVNHLSPENPFVKLFLGLKVGGCVTSGTGEGWTVQLIKHRHLHMMHDLLNKVHLLSGNKPSVQKIHVDPDNPDFSKIFEISRNQQDRTKTILSTYSKQTIPLRTAADSLDTSPIDFYDCLPNDNVQIVSSNGNTENLHETEKNVLEARDKGCVIDAVTLHCLCGMGLLEKVKEFFGAVRAPQSLIDQHLGRYEKSIAFGNTSGGSLRPAGDKFELVDYNEEDTKNWADIVEKELSLVRSSVCVEGITTNLPSNLRTDPFDFLSVDFWDDALIAKQSNSILISEDRLYRELVSKELEVSTAWLQPVLFALVKTEIIDFETYVNSIAHLSLYNHYFLSINADVLYFLWENSPDKLDTVLKNLFCDSAEPSSHFRVAITFLLMLWKDDTPNLAKLRATGRTLERMMQPRYIDVSKLATFLMQTRYFPTQFRVYFQNWCTGHFLHLGDPSK